MVAIDKKKALELFKRITEPKITPVAYEDIFISDPSIFYETLGVLAKNLFTPTEISNGEIINLVKPYISKMDSPVQVRPVALLLTSLPIATSQQEIILQDFSNALGKITGDDNSFSESLDKVVDGIMKLLDMCKKRGIARDDLLLSLRQYFINHLSGSRCAAEAGSKTPRKEKSIFTEIDFFNMKLRVAYAAETKQILPLFADEIKPFEVKGFCKEEAFWFTRESMDYLNRFKKLRFNGDEKRTDAEKESVEWRFEFQKYLDDLMLWKGSETEESAPFHEKIVLLIGIVEIAPDDKLREAALRNFIKILNDSALYREKRIEWFVHANYLITLTIRDELRTGRSAILTELKESKNPVLALFAKLEEMIPTRFQ